MRDFMLARGWEYKGQCSCTPRMDIYVHSGEHRKYQVWINNMIFKIKDTSFPIPRTATDGVIQSFESLYERFFNPKADD